MKANKLDHPLLLDERAAKDLAAGYPNPVYFDQKTNELCFGEWVDAPSAADYKPFPMQGGVAIISVYGFLEHRSYYAGVYTTGYESIARRFQAALMDDDVKGIMLDVDSHGGEVAGCFECASMIYKARGVKPIRARVYPNAFSAAYAIASAADSISVSETGSVGSIGVVQLHVDHSEALANEGVKPTLIYAGKHKVDGNPYEPLGEGARAHMQARIEAMYNVFVGAVSKHRSINSDAVRATEARTLDAEEAISAGLADAVLSPEEALASFITELSGSYSKDTTMSDQNIGAGSEGHQEKIDVQAIASESASAERERIGTILGSEEASGREELANHLAMKTSLSAEEAKGILAAQPAAKVETSTETVQAGNAFEQAMAVGNPEAGAEPKVDGAQPSEFESAMALWDKH